MWKIFGKLFKREKLKLMEETENVKYYIRGEGEKTEHILVYKITMSHKEFNALMEELREIVRKIGC